MKPKEWKINTIHYDNGHASHDIQRMFPGDKVYNDSYTHVIEKSAYEEKCREFDDYRIKRASCCNDLEELVDELVSALEIIALEPASVGISSKDVAIEALSKIKEQDK